MALSSPGIEVTVIDESFYTPAEPGTTPLIVVATAQDKVNASGVNTASATLKANAGRPFRITSQRELIELFGVPFFEKTASSSPIHGGERNEYGLLTAYSYLGVSNSAFIVRADVDLGQLVGRAAAPGSDPIDGAWWVDTGSTAYGIQEWNSAPVSTTGGQKFSTKTPIRLTDRESGQIEGDGTPKESVGSIGDYAVVFQSSEGDEARIYYKSAGNTEAGVPSGKWVLVGSNDWTASHPTVIGTNVQTAVAGNIVINSVTVVIDASDSATAIAAKISGAIPGITAKAVTGKIYIYTDGSEDIGDSSLRNAIQIDGNASTLLSIGLPSGTFLGPQLQQSTHTQVPRWKSSDPINSVISSGSRPTGSVWIKTTEPNNGARWRVRRWNAATASWVLVEAPLYPTTHAALAGIDRSGGGVNIPVNSLFVQTNSTENIGYDVDPATATFKMWRRKNVGVSKITSTIVGPNGFQGFPSSFVFYISESVKGSSTLNSIEISVNNITFNENAANLLAGAINSAGLINVQAAVTEDNRVEIFHKLGGDFRITDSPSDLLGTIFAASENFYILPTSSLEDFLVSNWQPFSAVSFIASSTAPLEEAIDGQLWYNPEFSEVDIMVHDGETWRGYRNIFSSTNSNGPTVSASNPYNSNTETGDLWISTADLENFPTIYRYDAELGGAPSTRWVLVDKTDQNSENGILFADARYGTAGVTGDVAGSIKDLLVSDYLDPDSPDPALYPRGMLLWNTRRSGGNVKRFANNYIDTTLDNPRFDPQNTGGQSMQNYARDRWVTASPNNEDGSGSFGRKAQRAVVVQKLKSIVDLNDELRDEERRNFNLIACPGYPELLSNLVNLNLDRGVTSFVIGDTPLRLPSDATSLTRWGTNELLVTDNGDDGIVTYDEYLAVFYPNGITTDLGGASAVVPASHMMMRTIALSDNVSYPWFAPAGTRRGGITNATAVGYINKLTGEFTTVALNEGQRDTLYDLKVNPITFFNGVGLVNYGQKTRARNASALDRINVARLVVYLRSQLTKLARPYVFEPNDKTTREEVKQAVESLLLELVGLRALYDFAVVCDESNNTPTRIDRNELWVDIAIEPVKAIEFIYIPLRVKNTGEI
jgi:hypothetical protein